MKRISGDQITKGLTRQKFAWVDRQLQKVLPPGIYIAMHAKDPVALGWVKEHGYHIEEDGDVVSIMRGANLVARTRMVLELKDLSELDALVKVVKVVPPQKV